MFVKVQIPKTPRFRVWDEFTKTGKLTQSLGVQAKLLRAVEDGEIVPLGDHTYKHIDVRILAASSVLLWESGPCVMLHAM